MRNLKLTSFVGVFTLCIATVFASNAHAQVEIPTSTYTTEAALASISAISGADYLCQNSGGQSLTAVGGSGNWGNYQWGYVNASNQHVVLSGEGPTIYVNPTATTKYWVRTKSGSTYGPYVYKNVTYYQYSTQPSSIQVSYNSCMGTHTLTAVGGVLRNGAYYEWHIGYNPGNVIATTTGTTITVPNPTGYNAGYFVRIVEVTPCSNPQWGANVSVNRQTNAPQPQLLGTVNPVIDEVCKNNLTEGVRYQGNATVLRWESSPNADFSSAVKVYNTTTTFLTPAQIGPLVQTLYFRAVVQSSTCGINPTPAQAIRLATPAIYNGTTWSKQPSGNTPIEIRSNLTINRDLQACSCEIKNNAQVTVSSGSKLILHHDLKVNTGSTLVFEDKASLIQIDNNAVNEGHITKKVTTNPMKNYDYTYWSSPVSNMTLRALSPNTLSDKYHSFDPVIGNWVNHVGGNITMEAGLGYIVRAPQGWSTSNATAGKYTAQFTGVPTNGYVSIPVRKGESNLNLIGNPYPSAIDIDSFITHEGNQDALDGTVYFWTHSTALAQVQGLNGLNYIADDYAKYNLTGGVGVGYPALSLSSTPTGKVASGQGFFVMMNKDLAANQAVVKFDNAMRLPNNAAQFFRQAQTDLAATKSRIWLHLHNALGAYNQILIGYVPGATNEIDRLFDGVLLEGNSTVNLYSLHGETALSIQGRALPFEANDVVPLGMQVTTAGTYTLGLHGFDGLFEAQAVYLYDRLLDVYHNLKMGDYSFSTSAGVIDDRFEIRYTESALGTHDWNAEQNLMFVKDNQVHVQAAQNIQAIRIVDMTGRVVYEQTHIGERQLTSAPLAISPQVVLVQMTYQSGTITTQKLFFN